MKIIIKDIFAALFILMLICAFIAAVLYGFDKTEMVKCLKLQSQADEYPAFTLTVFEKDMCEYHEIIINAPVQ